MTNHVIKYDHIEGVKLKKPVVWCLSEHDHGWLFKNAQHVALAVGGSVSPCKACVKAIIKQLEKEANND